MENMKGPITNHKIKAAIKNPPTNRNPGAGWHHGGISSNIQRRTNTCLSPTIPKISRKGKTPELIYLGVIAISTIAITLGTYKN